MIDRDQPNRLGLSRTYPRQTPPGRSDRCVFIWWDSASDETNPKSEGRGRTHGEIGRLNG
jgi:hypothetical protein